MIEWFDAVVSQAMGAVHQGNIGALSTLFFTVALTEAGVPLPFILDTVLFFTSYQSGILSMQVLWVFLMVFLGRLFGSSLVYWITRLSGNALTNRFEKRFPSLRSKVDRLINKLSHHAPLAVALCRLTSLLTLASMASGAIGLHYYYFIGGVVLSSIIFDGALIALGFATRLGFDRLGFTPSAWHVVVGLIIGIALVWIIIRFLLRRSSSREVSKKKT